MYEPSAPSASTVPVRKASRKRFIEIWTSDEEGEDENRRRGWFHGVIRVAPGAIRTYIGPPSERNRILSREHVCVYHLHNDFVTT